MSDNPAEAVAWQEQESILLTLSLEQQECRGGGGGLLAVGELDLSDGSVERGIFCKGTGWTLT